ncbi:MAG: transcriptional regulator GcvA [Pseudomonadota bacterium]
MKSTRLPPLNALRAFAAASRHMSFQKAADELSVTPSALSFQIRQLEEYLQVSLFERHNKRVELTDVGRRFAPGVREGFERLQAAMEVLVPSTPPNVLTVSTGPAFASKWLSPRIYKFLEQYPDIEFRISANLGLVNFAEDPVDAVIRFGGGNYPGLHVEPIANEATLPLAAPSLVEKYGGKLTSDDLTTITLLHDDSAAFLPNAVTWATWLSAEGLDNVDASRGARFNYADHALEAAVDGAGIVMGRLTLASRDIAAGRLVAPFQRSLPSQAGFYFCCLPQRLEVPKIVAFRDFIRAEMDAERPVLERFVAK